MPPIGEIPDNQYLPNKGEDLSNERIADYFTSLLHVSGADLVTHEYGISDLLSPNDVYDGVGNTTGLALSALHDRVIINNYIYPPGYDDDPTTAAIEAEDPTEWLDAFFPIGVIMLTINNNDPSLSIAGTKWCQIDPPGQFLVGVGQSMDIHDDVVNFAAHDKQPLGGDLAGEYMHKITPEELPRHTHNTNTGDVALAPQNGAPNTAGGDGQATNVSFFYYFGPWVNDDRLKDANSSTGAFLGQDRIEAFQNNADFVETGERAHGLAPGTKIEKYRDWLVKERHYGGDEPYLYTDEDFNPRLGNYPLVGWGGNNAVYVPAGGPGWGGFLDRYPETVGISVDPRVDDAPGRRGLPEFISNSPVPINIPWELNNKEVVTIQAYSGWDQRRSNRVHPGEFSSRQLIIARDYLINVLGVEDATVALENVNRLIELDATVPQALAVGATQFVTAKAPGTGVTRSLNTGRGGWHNNVPPYYGVFAWRRVDLDHTCGSTVPEIGPLWQAIIEVDQISTRHTPFNLNNWAKEHISTVGASTGRVWNGKQPAKITIAEGVYIYSDDNHDSKVPAMTIESFPTGLILVNNGFIMGQGGNGGTGVSGVARHGKDGGDAIEIIGERGEITIVNANGAIGGGGGGGGNDGGAWYSGGGGGAGGGLGGRCRRVDNFARGGALGLPGANGRASCAVISKGSVGGFSSDIMNDGFGLKADWAPGVGGEAGGSGGVAPGMGGFGWKGCAGGGGGGRVLSRSAKGGGGGGVPGSTDSGLKADGSVKGHRDGPPRVGPCRKNGPCGSRRGDRYGWISGAPLNDSGKPGKKKKRPGQNPKADAFYIQRQNTSANCKKKRLKKGKFSCTAWFTNYGWHYNKNVLPYITATLKLDGGYVTSHMSPTGWNSDYHFSSYVHGGYAGYQAENSSAVNTLAAGAYKSRPGGARGHYAAGGGGWGAAGGSTGSGGLGGEGGRAITRTGPMPYAFVDEEGNPSLGLVYGTREE